LSMMMMMMCMIPNIQEFLFSVFDDTYCCRFIVKAQSQAGGQKVGNRYVTGGSFPTTNLVGLITNRLVKFRVDLRPPEHCLLRPPGANDNCACFPIHLDRDVRTV